MYIYIYISIYQSIYLSIYLHMYNIYTYISTKSEPLQNKKTIRRHSTNIILPLQFIPFSISSYP